MLVIIVDNKTSTTMASTTTLKTDSSSSSKPTEGIPNVTVDIHQNLTPSSSSSVLIIIIAVTVVMVIVIASGTVSYCMMTLIFINLGNKILKYYNIEECIDSVLGHIFCLNMLVNLLFS